MGQGQQLARLANEGPIDPPCVNAHAPQFSLIGLAPNGGGAQPGEDILPDAGEIPHGTSGRGTRMMLEAMDFRQLQPLGLARQDANHGPARACAEVNG